MPKDDVFDDPQIQKMLRDFREKVMPNIKESRIVLSVIGSDMPDAKLCLEMGAAVLMDKPIMVICIPGAQCSQHLLKIATEVVEVEGTRSEADNRKIQDAIRRMTEGVA